MFHCRSQTIIKMALAPVAVFFGTVLESLMQFKRLLKEDFLAAEFVGNQLLYLIIPIMLDIRNKYILVFKLRILKPCLKNVSD